MNPSSSFANVPWHTIFQWYRFGKCHKFPSGTHLLSSDFLGDVSTSKKTRRLWKAIDRYHVEEKGVPQAAERSPMTSAEFRHLKPYLSKLIANVHTTVLSVAQGRTSSVDRDIQRQRHRYTERHRTRDTIKTKRLTGAMSCV